MSASTSASEVRRVRPHRKALQPAHQNQPDFSIGGAPQQLHPRVHKYVHPCRRFNRSASGVSRIYKRFTEVPQPSAGESKQDYIGLHGCVSQRQRVSKYFSVDDECVNQRQLKSQPTRPASPEAPQPAPQSQQVQAHRKVLQQITGRSAGTSSVTGASGRRIRVRKYVGVHESASTSASQIRKYFSVGGASTEVRADQ